MKIKFGALTAVLISGLAGGFAMRAAAQAPSADASIQARIRALEIELESLKKLVNAPPREKSRETAKPDESAPKPSLPAGKPEAPKDTAADKAKTAVSVSAGANGFAIRTADTNFVLKIRGYIQTDGRFYPDDHSAGTANDTLLMRRVRPIFEGTMYEKYDFRVMLDFASGITTSAANNGFVQDAYLNARFLPEFQVQAGKFKEPAGLERLQSASNLLFVERGYPTQLIPNRDVGIQLQGDLFDGMLSYAAGVFNGVSDGGSGDFETSDDEKDVAGRLFAHPFKNTEIAALKGFGVGVAGTFGNQEGALRNLVSPGQQRMFSYRTGAGTSPATANVVADGDHWRVSAQGYYYWGPFGLFGEYVVSNQQVRRDDGAINFGRVEHTAWQVAVSYYLTGEENSWKAVTPQKPFSPGNGGWGAWEVAARYGELDVDDGAFAFFANPATSASKAMSWAVGLNWYLNKNVKLNLDYEQTDFSGGGTPLLDKGEKAILTRAQLSF